MDRIIDVQRNGREHIYDIDNCAGCGEVIEGIYEELGLPSGDNKSVTHIALCEQCSGIAKSEGVI